MSKITKISKHFIFQILLLILILILTLILPKNISAQSCVSFGELCGSDFECCSPLTCQSGVCQPISNILNNPAISRSCRNLCLENGYAGCTSIGTDDSASNGLVWTFSDAQCTLADYYNCYYVIYNTGVVCGGELSTWTNCNCYSYTPPPTPTPTPIPTATLTPTINPTPTISTTPTPTPIILNVPMFKQTDLNWSGHEYDSGNSQSLWCGQTIGDCGCALSSVSMILKYFGIDKDLDGNPTNPSTVNNYFKKNTKCNTEGCVSLGYRFGNLWWASVGNYSADSYSKYGTQKIIFQGYDNYYDYNQVSDEIYNNRPVSLKVPGTQHWVVAKGIDDNSFLINDPAYPRLALNDPAYQNNALAMRRFHKTSSDFSSFEVTAKLPSQILVTDSSGRRTGFDKATGNTLKEIPNSTYFFEDAYSNPGLDDPLPPNGTGINSAFITTPPDEIYKVEIVLPVGEEYSFAVYGTDVDASTLFELYEGSNKSNENNMYTFRYRPTPGGNILTQKIDINVKRHTDHNKIVSKSNGLIEIAILSSKIFDAPNDIIKDTLTFGKTGDEKSFDKCIDNHQDVNKDGYGDLVCFFRINKTDISIIDGENQIGILKDFSNKNIYLEGADFVEVK